MSKAFDLDDFSAKVTGRYLYFGLSTCLQEAADSQGLEIRTADDPSGLGRLMWSIAGGPPLTPGMAAAQLGIPPRGRWVEAER